MGRVLVTHCRIHYNHTSLSHLKQETQYASSHTRRSKKNYLRSLFNGGFRQRTGVVVESNISTITLVLSFTTLVNLLPPTRRPIILPSLFLPISSSTSLSPPHLEILPCLPTAPCPMELLGCMVACFVTLLSSFYHTSSPLLSPGSEFLILKVIHKLTHQIFII